MDRVIEIENIYKTFGKIQALHGVSVDIRKGEIFGFLGPNGAGKSTTIRCVMNFINPDSGSIKVFGTVINNTSEKYKKRIGYVPAETFFYDTWTGRDYIDFIAAVKEVSPGAKRKLELDDKKRIRDLSTGNRQKLAIELALIGEPELLILDEPTRGLDPVVQNEVHGILHDYCEKGGTVFLSSHDMLEVEKLCSRIGMIKKGELATVTTIEQLHQKRIYSISVTFMDTYSKEDFALPGVTIEHGYGNELKLKIHGDIDRILKLLAQYSIKDIEVLPASVEDVFLAYYNEHNGNTV